MKMNQSGFSLIQVMLSMALMIAGAKYAMDLSQEWNKNEVNNKIRSEMNLRFQEVGSVLNSSELCRDNVYLAFSGGGGIATPVTFPNGVDKVLDNDIYSRIKPKGIVDSVGNVLQFEDGKKDYLKQGDLIHENRIYVKNINYEIINIVPGQAWDREGKLKITVVMEKCNNGGAIAFNPTQIVCKQEDRLEVKRYFEKAIKFNLNADSTLKAKPRLARNPAATDPPTPAQPATKEIPSGDLTCTSDSDASNDFAILKACQVELNSLINAEKSGQLDCGIELIVKSKSREFPGPTYGQAWRVPMAFLPGSGKVSLMGGGGGGGGADTNGNNESSDGGTAGKFATHNVNIKKNQICSLTIGRGGPERGPDGDGNPGGKTSFTCGSIDAPFEVDGGVGGREGVRGNDDCGGGGENATDNFGRIISWGGRGSCNGGAGEAGSRGSGGGGGSERHHKNGRAGGAGFIKIEYKTYCVKDPNNVLPSLSVLPGDYNMDCTILDAL